MMRDGRICLRVLYSEVLCDPCYFDIFCINPPLIINVKLDRRGIITKSLFTIRHDIIFPYRECNNRIMN
jgi:hypothetical protein